jgi:uncharacterized Tic20 family protein
VVLWILNIVLIFSSLHSIVTLVWWVLIIGNIVLVVLAGMAANKGQAHRYPYAYRLVK